MRGMMSDRRGDERTSQPSIDNYLHSNDHHIEILGTVAIE